MVEAGTVEAETAEETAVETKVEIAMEVAATEAETQGADSFTSTKILALCSPPRFSSVINIERRLSTPPFFVPLAYHPFLTLVASFTPSLFRFCILSSRPRAGAQYIDLRWVNYQHPMA